MDPKTELKIMLGAAIGANCIPCFDHLYAKARENHLEEAEIEKIVALAFKVKNGAGVFLKKAIGDILPVEIAEAETCCDQECAC